MITNDPEFDQTSKICYVKNSLEKNCDSCKNILKANDYMVDITQEGYQISLHCLKTVYYF